jgi:hypothetical protein
MRDMKNENMKIEKCKVDDCLHCPFCAAKTAEEKTVSEADAKANSELYNREAEQYYFYFIGNKAS